MGGSYRRCDQCGKRALSIATRDVAGPRRSGLLVARDWTNVRKSRTVRAPLEAMLLPGDTVVADSLERNWYRVALYGEVLGYAHRSTLAPPGGE